MKDKAWLKEQFTYYREAVGPTFNDVSRGMNNAYDNVEKLIDQLEEPIKPVIPQFVADWIVKERLELLDWHTKNPERFFMILGHKLHYTTLANTNISDWVFDGNEEKLYQALKYGYEVEKEKKYIIKFAPSIYGTPTYGSIGTQNGKKIMQSVYGSQGITVSPNQYTEEEIKEVGSEYIIFAEEVTE